MLKVLHSRMFYKYKEDESQWNAMLKSVGGFIEVEKCFVYCGSREDLEWDYIVPRSLLINERCVHCVRIQGAHNQVSSCLWCKEENIDKGMYAYHMEKHSDDALSCEEISPIHEKKYLSILFNYHECIGTL